VGGQMGIITRARGEKNSESFLQDQATMEMEGSNWVRRKASYQSKR